MIAAYEYLVEHYEEGDRIFLFGFSRGAYAVRILAAMIHKIGLLPRSRKHLVGAALVEFEKFSAGQANKDGEVTTPTEWKLNIDEAYTFGRNSKTRWVEIEFLGLWDTVASLIRPNIENFNFPGLTHLAYPRAEIQA